MGTRVPQPVVIPNLFRDLHSNKRRNGRHAELVSASALNYQPGFIWNKP